MQRTYRERRYMCGDYMEVAIFPVYAKAKGRGKRRKPSSDAQQHLNHYHAEGKLRRLLNTNFTRDDLFVTLTFDEAHLPATVEEVQRILQNFLRRAKRAYAKRGLELKYVAVIEQGGEQKRLHIHLVISGGLSLRELDKLWGKGMVTTKKLTFEDDGLGTLARYLVKGTAQQGSRPTWKRWSASRNLVKPAVQERDGKISHRKMVEMCEKGAGFWDLDDTYNDYDLDFFSIRSCRDLYGGFLLFAMLTKKSTTAFPWSSVGERLCYSRSKSS